MNDLLFIVLVLGGGIALVGGIAYLLQRRAKGAGPLFANPAGPTARIVALVLGLLFGAFFLFELLFTDRVHVVMPILAVALLAYSLGAGRLLGSLQREDRPQPPGAGQDERQRSISDPDTTTNEERNE